MIEQVSEKENKVPTIINLEQLDNFTLAVFGECGQGKSTLLNEIVEVYKD